MRNEVVIMGFVAAGVGLICGAIVLLPRSAPADRELTANQPSAVIHVGADSPSGEDVVSDWDISQRIVVEKLIAAKAHAPIKIQLAFQSSGQIGTQYCGEFFTQGGTGTRSFDAWIYPDDTSSVEILEADAEGCEPGQAWIAEGRTLSPGEGSALDEKRLAALPSRGEPWYAEGYSPADDARREAQAQARLDRTVKEMLGAEEVQRRIARGETVRMQDIDWR